MKNKEILLHTYYTAHKPERALKLQNAGENVEKQGFLLFVGRQVCWKTVWNCLIKFINLNMFFHNHQIQSFIFIQGDEKLLFEQKNLQQIYLQLPKL